MHILILEDGSTVADALCRMLRRETPSATELVRHCEHGQAVRMTVRVTRAEKRSARDVEHAA